MGDDVYERLLHDPHEPLIRVSTPTFEIQISENDMMKLAFGTFALAVALPWCAWAAGPGSTETFQGDIFITAAPSACGTTAAVGDYYRVLYRAKVATSDPADAFVFIGGRSAFRISSQASSGSLNGASTTLNAYFDSRGSFYSGVAGNSSLTFSPFSGTSVTATANIKVTGNVTSFYGVSGCDITIRGDLTLRPD